MRIAHLDTGRTWRGGQRQVLLLMRGVAARGHETLLLAPPGPLNDAARAEGLEVRTWRPFGEWDPFALGAAAASLRSWRADIAHCHSAHAHALGVPAARIARTPAAVVSRRVDFAVATHLGSRLKYRLPVDRYFCISRGVREVLREAGIPESKLALVPSGIELPDRSGVLSRALSSTPLRELLRLGPDARVVGTVAALAPHKDHATLLEAAALVAGSRGDVHFAWVGEGECRAALERRRAELRLEGRVHLMGFREDALPLLVQFDVFAMSSYLEGLGTSLLDAQALGVPVVATAVGGIPDAVANGLTGWLVPPRDPGAFAAALLEVLNHPGLGRERSARARESVRRFSADAMVEASLREYEAVLREVGHDARSGGAGPQKE